MPSRRDIDPSEIRHLLSNIMLIDVINGGASFRYRLVGTAIQSSVGERCTGRMLEEAVAEEARDSVRENYPAAVQAKRPVLIVTRYSKELAKATTAKRLFAPLSEDNATVSMLLCGYTFSFASPLNRRLPDGPEPMDRTVEVL
jgi:hypothetical protein